MKKTSAEQTSHEPSQTRTHEPTTLTPASHPLARLHDNVGNQAVLHFLRARSIQPKLTVSQPDDPYEQEADRIAEQVTSISGPQHAEIRGTGGMASAGALLQRKPKAVRFQEDITLDDVSEGRKVLKEPDKGEAVIRITTAMHDLGHYAPDAIDENFNPTLTTAVTNYQDSKGLKGLVPAGTVDQTTFGELDKDFSADYKVERDVISKQKSGDLLKGTQTIDATEKAAAEKSMSTEVQPDPITGVDPVFKNTVGKGFYKNRLFWVAEDVIIQEYKMYGQGKQAEHDDSKNLYDMADVEIIAEKAKNAVDQVFGEYYSAAAHPAFKKSVNLFDAWKDKEDALRAGGKTTGDERAEWRVEKIIEMGDEVKALDKEHGAKHSREPEKSIVAKVKSDLVKKYRTALIATDKGWPGYADPDTHKVFLQLFKGKSQDENKRNMWDFFQTLIHEYIHTLEHPDYTAARNPLPQQKGGGVLREGTADYFTKIVWNSITIDDALRSIIEGPYHDPANKFPIQDLSPYGESENAERLAGLVGIRNLAAAFFLGKVDLIGK